MKLLAVLLLIPGLRHVLRGGRVFDPANGIDRVTNVMSKLLNLGMSLEDIIESTTSKPAAVIRRDVLGRLSVGAAADVAVLRVLDGAHGFIDSAGIVATAGARSSASLRREPARWSKN